MRTLIIDASTSDIRNADTREVIRTVPRYTIKDERGRLVAEGDWSGLTLADLFGQLKPV